MSRSYAIGNKTYSRQRTEYMNADPRARGSHKTAKTSGTSSSSVAAVVPRIQRVGVVGDTGRLGGSNHPTNRLAAPPVGVAAAKAKSPAIKDKNSGVISGSTKGNIVTLSDLRSSDKSSPVTKPKTNVSKGGPATSNSVSSPLLKNRGRKSGKALSTTNVIRQAQGNHSRNTNNQSNSVHNRVPFKTRNTTSGAGLTRTSRGRGWNKNMADYGGQNSSNNTYQGGQQNTAGESGVSSGNTQQQGGDSQYVSSGAYTRITPNERKRQQITSQASKELKALEDYKAAKTPVVIKGAPQATGGRTSQEEARRKLEKEHRDKKYEQIRKRQQWQQEKRDREEKEYEEKKARAREQANRNKQLQAEREERFLKGDRARTNAGFLDRLEARQKYPNLESTHSSNGGNDLQMLIEMFPAKEPSKLKELLELCNGNVNKVIDFLQ